MDKLHPNLLRSYILKTNTRFIKFSQYMFLLKKVYTKRKNRIYSAVILSVVRADGK